MFLSNKQTQMSDLLYSIVGIAVGGGALYYLYTKDLQPTTTPSSGSIVSPSTPSPSDSSTPDPIPSPPPVPPAAPTGPSWVDFVSPIGLIKDAIEGNLTPPPDVVANGIWQPGGKIAVPVDVPPTPNAPKPPFPSPITFRNDAGASMSCVVGSVVPKDYWTWFPGRYTFSSSGGSSGQNMVTLTENQKTTGPTNLLISARPPKT